MGSFVGLSVEIFYDLALSNSFHTASLKWKRPKFIR